MARPGRAATAAAAPEPAVSGTTDAGPRSRTVMVTYLGAVVRPMGGWMPIGGTVDLVSLLGLDAPSVRTAVFRLKRRGWLEPATRAGVRGYELSATAQAALAAGDDVIWHGATPSALSEGWCVVTFSVPESARSKRHQLRSRLIALGFGNLAGGQWVAPARLLPDARQVVAELELAGHCAIFTGQLAGGLELRGLVAQAWDLEEIDTGYRRFIERYRHADALVGESDGAQPRDYFIAYLTLIDTWRRLPFRDPALPAEVLPEGWHAREAGRLFEALVQRWQAPAMEYAASFWPAGG
jgi:phenylacetic acid degradation operon negative regulatory protein